MTEQKSLVKAEDKKSNRREVVGELVYLFPKDKNLTMRTAKSGKKYAYSTLTAKVNVGDQTKFVDLDTIVFIGEKEPLENWFPKEGTPASTVLRELLGAKLLANTDQKRGKPLKVVDGVKVHVVLDGNKIKYISYKIDKKVEV